jgi:TM2 domain-containing membrane protein YozV
MKQSTTGAVFSGLVYPGVGQIALGRKTTGVVFIALTTGALVVIFYRIITRVYLAMDQIMPVVEEEASDFSQLIERFLQTSNGSWRVEIASVIFLVLCWAGSILHAYYLGRKLDRQA